MFSKKGRYIFTSVARENQVNLGFVSNRLRHLSILIAPLQCTITLYNRDEKTLRAVVWPDEIQDEDAGFFCFIREKTHAFLCTIFASFISVRLTAPSNITNLR